MRIGYARSSPDDKDCEREREALAAAGCDLVIVGTETGSRTRCQGLKKVRDSLQAGDTIVVWRLDSLSYSLRDLIGWMTYLKQENIQLVSIYDGIDTKITPEMPLLDVFDLLAEFERKLIRQRTQATIAAASLRGERFGRPSAITQDKRELAVKLYQEKKTAVMKICEMIGISKPTLYSYVRAAESKAISNSSSDRSE